ncbi:MAG: zinc ABC transporter substrate-binding protein [Candidatus Andersenbacteria bacterium]
MNILEEIARLNFPVDQYVVVGSGPMAAHGIRDVHDIDIVVTPELFEICKQRDWEHMPWTYPGKEGEIYLRNGIVELYLDVNAGDFNPTFQELFDRSEVVQSIHFASLEDIMRFKKAYNRPKHLEDIQKIKEHLTEA